jgi:hypothetical protein
MTSVPTGLPLLRRGAGATMRDGGCFVQVAGYLADGHSWSEYATSVHPVIRAAGIKCNDMMSAAARPRLAPLAGDAAGTGPEPSGVAGQVLTVRLLAWVAQRVSQHWSHRRLCQNAVNAALNWADCPCPGHRAVADRTHQAMDYLLYSDANVVAALAARTASADPISMPSPDWAVSTAVSADVAHVIDRNQALHDFLRDLIGEHQRLTGHAPAPPQRWGQVCELLGMTGRVATAVPGSGSSRRSSSSPSFATGAPTATPAPSAIR